MNKLSLSQVNESLSDWLKSPTLCVADELMGYALIKRFTLSEGLVSDSYVFDLCSGKSLVSVELEGLGLPLFLYSDKVLCFKPGDFLKDLECGLVYVLNQSHYVQLFNYVLL